jgi:hypothetical protein
MNNYLILFSYKKNNLLVEDIKGNDLFLEQSYSCELLNTIRNNIDKILLNFEFSYYMNKKAIKIKFLNDLKYLNIKLDDTCEKIEEAIIDPSNFDKLEYVSILSSNKAKLLFSNNQYKNIKILKLYGIYGIYGICSQNFSIKDFKDFNDQNKFENLIELHINFDILDKIHFNEK